MNKKIEHEKKESKLSEVFEHLKTGPTKFKKAKVNTSPKAFSEAWRV